MFDYLVALTVRLSSTWTCRTPKVHPGPINVRCPGEVHSINIIEGHASHLSIWIDPVRRPAAECYKIHPDHQGKEATAGDSGIAPSHPAVLKNVDILSLLRSARLGKKSHSLLVPLSLLEKIIGHTCSQPNSATMAK